MADLSTTKKVAHNTLYQLIGKGISMSITILATMIVTRVYGREGYGLFSLMQNWPALFFIIVDFGINAIATRELSKDWSKAEKYIGNIFLIRVIFSVLLILALGFALVFFPYSQELIFGIRLSLFLILTQALYATTNIVFQVKLRYDLSAIGYTVGYLVILALILVLSCTNAAVVWVNFSYVLGGIITFVINYAFVRKLGVTIKPQFDLSIWKYLMVSALPLGVMFIFSQMSFKEDALMLSVLPVPKKYGLSNTESVAIYSLPYKAFEVALVIPTFFMNSVYPILVRHMTEGKSKLLGSFTKSLKFLGLAGIIVSILGYVFASFTINVLGGDEFTQSVNVLRILVLGLVFYYVTQPLAWLIVTLEKQKYLPWVYLVGAAFNLVANLIFIPKYSFYAASVITHLSEVLILFLLIIAAVKAWKSKYAAVSV